MNRKEIHSTIKNGATWTVTAEDNFLEDDCGAYVIRKNGKYMDWSFYLGSAIDRLNYLSRKEVK